MSSAAFRQNVPGNFGEHVGAFADDFRVGHGGVRLWLGHVKGSNLLLPVDDLQGGPGIRDVAHVAFLPGWVANYRRLVRREAHYLKEDIILHKLPVYGTCVHHSRHITSEHRTLLLTLQFLDVGNNFGHSG